MRLLSAKQLKRERIARPERARPKNLLVLKRKKADL